MASQLIDPVRSRRSDYACSVSYPQGPGSQDQPSEEPFSGDETVTRQHPAANWPSPAQPADYPMTPQAPAPGSPVAPPPTYPMGAQAPAPGYPIGQQAPAPGYPMSP